MLQWHCHFNILLEIRCRRDWKPWAGQHGIAGGSGKFTQCQMSGLFSSTKLTLSTSTDTVFLNVLVFWSSIHVVCAEVFVRLWTVLGDCLEAQTYLYILNQSIYIRTILWALHISRPSPFSSSQIRHCWQMCFSLAPEPIYYCSQRAIDYACIQERCLLSLIRKNLVDVKACNYLQIERDLNAASQCSLSIKQ